MSVTDTVYVLFIPHTHCYCYDFWKLDVKGLAHLATVCSCCLLWQVNLFSFHGCCYFLCCPAFNIALCAGKWKLFLAVFFFTFQPLLNCKQTSPLQGERWTWATPSCHDALEVTWLFQVISRVLPSRFQKGQSTFHSQPFLPHWSLNVTLWSGLSDQT